MYLLWRLPLPKLPRLSGSAVCKILAQNGFEKVRQRGSHIIMQKHIGGTTITVPVPDHKELRTGTFRSIIRQSGLPTSTFKT
ncbi:MAG: type II toxin-antitoxin system HicA family toxin [Verrucomicrobiota bacterium]